jgi:hypothetical protein
MPYAPTKMEAAGIKYNTIQYNTIQYNTIQYQYYVKSKIT